MTTTPPGWYDDGHGVQRWWDGQAWTEHVQPEAAVPAAGSGAPGAGSATGLDAGSATGRRFPLWIVFVVLGVLLAGLVTAAAVYLPRVFTMLESAGPVPELEDTPSPLPETTDPSQEVELSALTRDAAVAAVELYDDAWKTGDCDHYLAATTPSFREQLQLTDCTTFTTEATAFSEFSQDYALTVTDVYAQGDDVIVETSESFTTDVDMDGNPIDPPTTETVLYLYVVVSHEGGWAIDQIGEP
ncbi:DUF2510 domain-containing protein [Microbacterium sp.]|uniref:DUF2510 domain-containing protein n=1 Tax=Microbacterium sp. TaxID=51671 RepID=UPI0039E3A307